MFISLFQSDEAVLPGDLVSSQTEKVNNESIQTNHTRVIEFSKIEKVDVEKVNNEYNRTNECQTSVKSLIGNSTVVKIIGNISNATSIKRPNEFCKYLI